MTINWTHDRDDIAGSVRTRASGKTFYVVGRCYTGPIGKPEEPEEIEYAMFDDRESAIEAILADHAQSDHGDLTWTRPDTTAVADDGYGWSIIAVTGRKAS